MVSTIRCIVTMMILTTNSSNAARIDFSSIFPDLLETQSVTDAARMTFNSSMLTLETDYNVSVFFISEGAAFKNSFGWYEATKDGTRHVIAGVYPEFGIVALGFEDIWGGGDRDYNDLLVAIDLGIPDTQQLVMAATGVSSPKMNIMLMMAILLVALQHFVIANKN